MELTQKRLLLIGKILLIKILDTFTNKFAALNLAFPSILKQAERKKLGEDSAADDDFDFEKAKSIHTASSSTDIQVDPAKGMKDFGSIDYA
jgi:transformation/transcription domain-associated protein